MLVKQHLDLCDHQVLVRVRAGVSIMSTYKHGSVRMGLEAHQYAGVWHKSVEQPVFGSKLGRPS